MACTAVETAWVISEIQDDDPCNDDDDDDDDTDDSEEEWGTRERMCFVCSKYGGLGEPSCIGA